MVDRRTFFKNTIVTTTGLLVLPLLSFDVPQSGEGIENQLEEGFLRPPGSARPQAYWMWMNGHITKSGITLDLEAMQQMGLGGAFIYNTGTGIPKGSVDYGSELWHEMLTHAMTEARRLGLVLSVHNAPGYSSTAGPWVPLDKSMQQLVWSETVVTSNGTIDVKLPQPYTRLHYYKDAFVVAYPSVKGDNLLMKDKLAHVYLNGTEIDKAILLDNNPDTKIEFNQKEGEPFVLLLKFKEPFEARAVSITRTTKGLKEVYNDVYDHPPSFLLESSADGIHFQTVCTVNMPLVRYIAAPGTQNFTAVKATYFRLSTKAPVLLAGVELHAGPRLPDWPVKTNLVDGDILATKQDIDLDFCIDPSKVIDLTDNLGKDGRLIWDAPSGNWTILRIGHTCTGAKNASPPESGFGLEIDKFSQEAVDFYFDTYLTPLITRLKPFIPQTFNGILIDSYEVGKHNWTESFPAEFRQRRGYDLVPWLPAFTGRIMLNMETTEKFLWDVRRAQADLVAANYHGRFQERCHELGLHFYSEPYGDGVFDGLQLGQYLDVPMAEFWTRYVPGTMSICDQAVSIAHGYGKKIAAVEAFTGMPFMSRWTEYPYALKGQGDHIYSRGVNLFAFHVFVHQPYTTGLPGMTMGPYGTHFDRNVTWIKQSSEWIKYLTRTQYLLQQGLYVADICYFKGEEPVAASGIPDVNHAHPPTPRNLAGDVIGPDVLLKRIKIKKERIVLPDGMSYSLMIMAPLQKSSPEIVRKLQSLVADGMTLIVTSKPDDTPGLTGQPEVKTAICKMVAELWGDLDGSVVKSRSYGNGKMYWNTPLNVILKRLNVKPDFEFTTKKRDAVIHYTHRRLGDTDIYFISNHLRRSETIVCHFRVKEKTPEIWNAETGTIETAAIFDWVNDRVCVPLTFTPAGSVFVIFRKKVPLPSFLSVTKNGMDIITAKPFVAIAKPFEKVADNFAISLWIKPDTYAFPGKGILIFPAEGAVEYGPGHACCGLAAGQNLVRVFERTKGPNRDAQQLIVSTTTLQGWTHIVLRYVQGKPSLFINGTLAGTHEGSGNVVHPGMQTPPTDELFSAIFEGNYTQPKLYTEVLSDKVIEELFQKGIPAPALPATFSIGHTQDGALQAAIWENGNYMLKGKQGNKSFNVMACKMMAIETPWRVAFPSGSGAPPILLDTLVSLHQHPHFDVRHFSGTVTYFNTFQLAEQELSPGRKLLLDLGRVEVLAEVILNGANFGIAWKEPYCMDITKAVVAGTNKLEIRVTNMWPNRMIGDAYLPEENTYDKDGLITKFPEWYIAEQPKPGQRKTFSAWNTFRKTDPLLASGLLGPVRLFFGVNKSIR